MKSLERLTSVAVILLSCIGCDQGTKALANEYLAGKGPLSFFGDTVRLQYSENPGALLSIGSRLPEAARFWVFSVFVTAVLTALLLYLVQDDELTSGQVLALSLILGGGVSNLIDRVFNDGAVVDFMNIGLDDVRTGIFNVADVAVFGGVGLFLLHYLRRQETHDGFVSEDELDQ